MVRKHVMEVLYNISEINLGEEIFPLTQRDITGKVEG